MRSQHEVVWPLPKPTLSPSAISSFITCPEKFRRQYIRGERDPYSWSALLGNTVHRAQRVNFGQKRVTGRDLTLPEIEDVYGESYQLELDEAGGPSEINWKRSDGGTVLPSKAIDIARPVNRIYHEKVAPTVQPLATEQWVEIRVPGVVPRIVGKIDVMKLRGGKVDLKFGGSAPSKPRNDWQLQASIYNLADDGSFEWHTGSWGSQRYGPNVHTPATAPELLIVPGPEDHEITERLIRSYAAAMAAYWYRFGPDDPWPGDGRAHQFACSYCPFHPDGTIGGCPYWPKARPAKAKKAAATLL